MIVRFTAASLADIREIGAWLSENVGPASVKIVKGLRSSCRSLADMPLRFPLVPTHEHTGVRRRVYGNYLIFYRASADGVLVLRVLHGARDVERILFPEA